MSGSIFLFQIWHRSAIARAVQDCCLMSVFGKKAPIRQRVVQNTSEYIRRERRKEEIA